MTAKEMFEELGFECEEYDGKIVYGYQDDYNTIVFTFHKTRKMVECLWKEHSRVVSVTIHLHFYQAINKQIEELGWNNE